METKVTEATAELRLMEITEPAIVSKEENEQAGKLQRYLVERAKQQSHQCFMVFEMMKEVLPTFQLWRFADVSDGIIRMLFQNSEDAEATCSVDVFCPRGEATTDYLSDTVSFAPGMYNVFCSQLGVFSTRISLEEVSRTIQKARCRQILASARQRMQQST